MKHILIFLINFYRKFISPLTPPKCKYYPTCSTYALTAIRRFGAVRGSALAVWRILRCNPWSLGGVDYVPEKFTFKVRKYDYWGGLSADSDGECNEEDNKNTERYEN